MEINPTPNEIADRDSVRPRSNNIAPTIRNTRIVSGACSCRADRVFKEFRARFCGKCSPVHFFWGSFDLAVTRFSGRPAPPHPGGVPHLPDAVTREAYSQEVSSLGFWPGNEAMPDADFLFLRLSGAGGFCRCKSETGGGVLSMRNSSEFVLPYDDVRRRRRLTMRCSILRKAPTTRLRPWRNGTGPRSRKRNLILHSSRQHP